MLSSDIYSQVGRGVRSVADYDAEAQGAKANKLQLLLHQAQFDEFGRKLADDNALRGVVQGFGEDTTANYNKLLQAGNLGAAKDYQKSVLDAAEAKGKAAKSTAETTEIGVKTRDKAFEYYQNVLGTIQDPVAAKNFVMHSYTDPTIGPILQSHGSLEEGLARIPTDPAQFQNWKANAAIGIKKLAELAKVQNVNLGGTMTTQMVQPATGQTTTLAQAPITQSADNAATQATSRANNAANVGATIRGQNLVDARSRESTSATMTKPFEVTGPDGQPMLVQQDKQGNIAPVQGFGPKAGSSKPLTDAQAKALGYGTRMQESDKIINEIGNNFSPLGVNTKNAVGKTPLIGGLLEAGANMSLSDNSQRAEQAQRDFVNAVLRRESGAAIADSEFQNARKQYFPQPGDSPALLAQKTANRKLAMEGVLAEVPKGQRGSITPQAAAPKADATAFTDADKERRYQEWKAKQAK